MKRYWNPIAIFVVTVLWAAAQPPRVRDINVYGLGKISKDRVLRAAKVRSGEPLPGSKGDMEDRMSEISGVADARVEAVCCEGSEVHLFLGIEERGGPHVAFRSQPTADLALANDLTAKYREYSNEAHRAAYRGETPAGASERQQEFSAFAESRLSELRQALRDAADPEQRAIAAAVIAYAPKKTEILDDLQFALQDPDETVRNQALHALHDLVVQGVRDPSLGIRVSPTWLIELLNSLVLSDRVQATDILLTLTDSRNSAILEQIRVRALPALAEMARWDTLTYALPPFLLLGRVAGIPETEIQRLWSAGQREPVIDKALGRPAGKSKGH